MKALTTSLLCLALVSGAFAKNLALLIGIDEYGDRDGISRLSGAENDVDGIRSALVDAAGFAIADIEVLKGPKASRTGIISALDRLKERSKPGDVIFFCYSGHGFQPEDTAFLVPFDALAGSDLVLRNSSLPASEVAHLLGQTNADLLVTSFDMCRNDPRVRPGRNTQANNSMSTAFDRDLRVAASNSGKGPRKVLRMFASSIGERSWENPIRKRGYFSWYLEQGLRGEASSDGIVKVGALIKYLREEVSTAVLRERGIEQRPDVKLEGTQVQNFILSQPKAPQKRTQTEFDRLIKQARSLPQAEASRKRDLLLQADSINGSDPLVKLLLGETFADLLCFPEAEEYFQKAVDLKPSWGIAYYEFGKHYFKHKEDTKNAEVMLQRAVQLTPEHWPAYSLLLDIYEQRHDFTKALQCWQQLMLLEPRLYTTFSGMPGGIIEDSNLQDDVKSYREGWLRLLIDNRPSYALALRMLGDMLLEKGDIDGAQVMLQRAITADKTEIWPYVHLAETFLRRGDMGSAEGQYLELVKNNPSSPEAFEAFGDFLYRKAKDNKAATEKYAKAAELDSKSGRLAFKVAEFYRNELKDFGKAWSYFELTIHREPEESYYLSVYADFLWKDFHTLKEAELTFRKAVEVPKPFSGAFISFAEFLLKEGPGPYSAENLLAIETLYNNGMNLCPTSGDLICSAARFFEVIRKDDKKAEALYRKAITLDAKYPLPYYGLADLYKKLNRQADLEQVKQEAAKNGVNLIEGAKFTRYPGSGDLQRNKP